MTRNAGKHALRRFATLIVGVVCVQGCDPAPVDKVPPTSQAQPTSAATFDMNGSVTYERTGEVQEFTWTIREGEGAAVQRIEPSGFKEGANHCTIEISRTQKTDIKDPAGGRVTRATTVLYRVAVDGPRYALIKGGVPYHALGAVDAEKAVIEALKFCKAEAAGTLSGLSGS